MSISTYTELVTACDNWLKRGGLDDRIPEFISLGESRIGREVKARQMEQRVSTPAALTVNLPSDYMSMRGVRVKGSTIGWLSYMNTDSFFASTQSDPSCSTNKYTIFGDELIFPIIPSGDIELWYYKKLSALSSATNTLFTSEPDLYLYAAMAAAQPFLKNIPMMPVWEQLYMQVKEAVNKSHKEGRYPSGMAVVVAS